MAAMLTALTEVSSLGTSRTYTYTGHTVQDPRMVLEKRRIPTGNQIVAESAFTVLSGTHDADGVLLPQRVSMQVIVRSPINGDTADVTAALAVFRDIIAGDEFANMVSTNEPLS